MLINPFHTNLEHNLIEKETVLNLIFISCYLIASSRAVLVQITPLLGALVGIVITLILIAICIVIFVRCKNEVRNIMSHNYLEEL